MAIYSIHRVQNIPAPLPQVWDFFSVATNLQAITPADMNFKIISRHLADRVYAGQIIEYRLRPVLGIPFYWMTEITHVEHHRFFVDEQRRGPYKLWHHQHHFKEINEGVEMTDIIHYQNPLWLLGDIANTLFVEKKLYTIFKYREQRIEELFGKWQ